MYPITRPVLTLIASLAALASIACSSAPEADTAPEPEAPAAPERTHFSVRTNCDLELEHVVWAADQWEAALPLVEISIELVDEADAQLVCSRLRLASAPSLGDDLIGGIAYADRAEIYTDFLDGETLIRNVIAHEIGHWLLGIGHVEHGMMQPVPMGEAPCIGDADIAAACAAGWCGGSERSTC